MLPWYWDFKLWPLRHWKLDVTAADREDLPSWHSFRDRMVVTLIKTHIGTAQNFQGGFNCVFLSCQKVWFYSSVVLLLFKSRGELWVMPAEVGSTQEALQQWSPQELCAPHWTFPRFFMSLGMLSHLLALHINVLSCSWAGACTQTGWGHKLQSFGTFQDFHQNCFLKRPHHAHSDNFIFIF